MQVFRSMSLPVFGIRFSSCNVWVTIETPLKSSVVELICRLKPTWENTFQWHLPSHLSFSYNPTLFISRLVFDLVPARVKLNVTIMSWSILNVFLPFSVPDSEKHYYLPFEDFVVENATLSNMLDVVVAKNCRPHLPNNSNDHEVSWLGARVSKISLVCTYICSPSYDDGGP